MAERLAIETPNGRDVKLGDEVAQTNFGLWEALRKDYGCCICGCDDYL